MTYEILKDTKIGRSLNKLKTHESPKVKKLAVDLQSFWKKEMNLLTSTTPAKKPIAEPVKPRVVEEVKQAIKTVESSGREPLNRDKIKEKFIQVLQMSTDKPCLPISQLASELEAEVFRATMDQAKYRAKSMGLFTNLKNFETFRTQVVTGGITPQAAATMQYKEMISN